MVANAFPLMSLFFASIISRYLYYTCFQQAVMSVVHMHSQCFHCCSCGAVLMILGPTYILRRFDRLGRSLGSLYAISLMVHWPLDHSCKVVKPFGSRRLLSLLGLVALESQSSTIYITSAF
jgi:hypothetical protein